MKKGRNISLIIFSLWLVSVITGFSIPVQHCLADNPLLAVNIDNTPTNNEEPNCCVNEDIHFSLATQVYFTPEKIHAPEKVVVELSYPINAVSHNLNVLFTSLSNEADIRIASSGKIRLLTGVFRL